MRRDQLEHLLRAACTVIDEDEVLVIGSQSILGSYSQQVLPPRATLSMEADLAVFDDPDARKADLIDGSLGEATQFHETYGYYAQGVTVGTAVFPDGWQERLVRLQSPNTRNKAGLCLEPHDLVLSKLARGDTRDYDFAAALLDAGLVQQSTLAERLETLPVGAEKKQEIRTFLRRWSSAPR